MRLNTKKGEFQNFAELRHAYMKSGENIGLNPGNVENAWEPEKLHASEIGGCPRATMLRICGAPRKVKAPLTEANEALMFRIAYFVHYLTYEAMEWAGILAWHERPVMEGVWAGRVDAMFWPDHEDAETWLYDCKTSRPNAFKYESEWPKEEHCLQLGAYGTELPDVQRGVIEYVDRGGSNIPVECVIDLEEWRMPATARMIVLEDYLDRCSGKDWQEAPLPPLLEEQFTPHYRKAPNMPYRDLKSVTYDAPWQCSYCDFHHTTPDGATRPESPCKPANHEPIVIAKLDKGSWSFHTSHAAEYVQSIPGRVQIGGDDDAA